MEELISSHAAEMIRMEGNKRAARRKEIWLEDFFSMNWKTNSPIKNLMAIYEAEKKKLERKRKAAKRKETKLEDCHFIDWLPTKRMEVVKISGGDGKLGWVKNNTPATYRDRPMRKAKRWGNRDNLVQWYRPRSNSSRTITQNLNK